jgi:hypothetical protein
VRKGDEAHLGRPTACPCRSDPCLPKRRRACTCPPGLHGIMSTRRVEQPHGLDLECCSDQVQVRLTLEHHPKVSPCLKITQESVTHASQPESVSREETCRSICRAGMEAESERATRSRSGDRVAMSNTTTSRHTSNSPKRTNGDAKLSSIIRACYTLHSHLPPAPAPASACTDSWNICARSVIDGASCGESSGRPLVESRM